MNKTQKSAIYCLSVFFLGLMATSVLAVYSSGFQSIDHQANHMLLDSKLRSRMEVLSGTSFSGLSSSSEMVTISGQNYTINWTVVSVDLNDDSIPEPTAKQVVVSVSGLTNYSLTTILVDNEDKVGKIP